MPVNSGFVMYTEADSVCSSSLRPRHHTNETIFIGCSAGNFPSCTWGCTCMCSWISSIKILRYAGRNKTCKYMSNIMCISRRTCTCLCHWQWRTSGRCDSREEFVCLTRRICLPDRFLYGDTCRSLQSRIYLLKVWSYLMWWALQNELQGTIDLLGFRHGWKEHTTSFILTYIAHLYDVWFKSYDHLKNRLCHNMKITHTGETARFK